MPADGQPSKPPSKGGRGLRRVASAGSHTFIGASCAGLVFVAQMLAVTRPLALAGKPVPAVSPVVQVLAEAHSQSEFLAQTAVTAVPAAPVTADAGVVVASGGASSGVTEVAAVAPALQVISAHSAADAQAVAAQPATGQAAALTGAGIEHHDNDAAGEKDGGGLPGLKPAKELFGAVKAPAPLAARAIGSYAKGCLSGGQALPVDGPAWQAMRLSRNRNWGHPRLVALVEKLATEGRANDGWPGLLVGDLAQPRGGPMLSGHASHQIGLDADIWLTPMPDRRLSNDEREKIEATSMLGEDGLTINRDVWTDAHFKIIKRAASYPDVERIFVHPAIKKLLCEKASSERGWLAKVRPYWGHYYHFHVRIGCPPGSPECEPQVAAPSDDGCGKEVDDWLKLLAKIKSEPAPLPIPGPAPAKPATPPKVKPAMTLDQLPEQCSVVLANGNPELAHEIAAAAAAKAAPKVAAKPAGKTHGPVKSAEKKTAAH